MEHELKTSLGYFDRIASGAKTLELRKGDRCFSVGDILHLRELDQRSYRYTGRSVHVQVTDLVTSSEGPWLSEGYVAMSIKLLAGTYERARFERTPEGHINNCALANGAPENECQICCGKCPDRHLF